MKEKKNMRYGQFLRYKRIADSRDLTLRDIAELLGVSVSFVSNVEQGSYDEEKKGRKPKLFSKKCSYFSL